MAANHVESAIDRGARIRSYWRPAIATGFGIPRNLAGWFERIESFRVSVDIDNPAA
jgi:hypothetical protein